MALAKSFRPQLLVVGLLLTSVQIAIPLLLARTPQHPAEIQPVQSPQHPDAQPVRYPRSRGSPSVSVQIVEFSSFACPSCKAVRGDLKEMLAQYGDRLFYTFRHFPKFSDSQAVHAHVAAECAAEQSAFWPYYDKLFDEQAAWHSGSAQKTVFIEYARELNLDVGRFETCFHDDAVFESVSKEIDQAEAMGVSHTPTFLVGDRLFVGPTQFRKRGIPLIKKLLEGEA